MSFLPIMHHPYRHPVWTECRQLSRTALSRLVAERREEEAAAAAAVLASSTVFRASPACRVSSPQMAQMLVRRDLEGNPSRL